MTLPGKIDTLLHLQARAAPVTKILVKLCGSIREEDLAIRISMRGVDVKNAAPVLAELGNYQDFESCKKSSPSRDSIPPDHQSGKLEGMSMISGRGNGHLRKIT